MGCASNQFFLTVCVRGSIPNFKIVGRHRWIPPVNAVVGKSFVAHVEILPGAQHIQFVSNLSPTGLHIEIEAHWPSLSFLCCDEYRSISCTRAINSSSVSVL